VRVACLALPHAPTRSVLDFLRVLRVLRGSGSSSDLL